MAEAPGRERCERLLLDFFQIRAPRIRVGVGSATGVPGGSSSGDGPLVLSTESMARCRIFNLPSGRSPT